MYVNNSGTVGTLQGSGQTQWVFFTGVGSGNEGVSGDMTIYGPGSGLRKSMIFNLSASQASGLHRVSGSGVWTTSAWNAFQFFYSSGNIASGTVRVYGLAK